MLLAFMLSGVGSVWADSYVVLAQSIKIGNDEGGWGGNTISASAFEGLDLKAGDVIEISRSGNASSSLQVTAGDWSDNFNFYAHYGWDSQNESVEIKDYTTGGNTYTADQIIAKIKEKGLLLNGTGPNNLKVRVKLVGSNRVALSGQLTFTGMTDKVAQIGDPVTYTYTLDPKFADAQNVKYKWFINDGETELAAGDDYVYKYVTGQPGTSNTFTFYPSRSTTEKQLMLCVHVSADGYKTDYNADWGKITVAPMHTPTIVQEGNNIKITVNANHWIAYSINGVKQNDNYSNSLTLSSLNNGDVIKANAFRPVDIGESHYYPSGADVTYTYTSFDPSINLSAPNTSRDEVEWNNGVLTAKTPTNNLVEVKDLNGHGNDYTGIALTYSGDPFRIVVKYMDGTEEKQVIKKVEAASASTTAYYSWTMLGVPSDKKAGITKVYFAGKQEFAGAEYPYTTTFTFAQLVNVTQAAATTVFEDGLRFNLKDTRVNWTGAGNNFEHGNIDWTYKETGAEHYAMMTTESTSYNMIQLYDFQDYNAADFTGINVTSKGNHYRILAYTSDNKTFTKTVGESSDKVSVLYAWEEFYNGSAAMTKADVEKINKISVAGCSDHSVTESVYFYDIYLNNHFSHKQKTAEGQGEEWNGQTYDLTYTDALGAKVIFNNTTGASRDQGGCGGLTFYKSETPSVLSHSYEMNVIAPAGYRITKLRVEFSDDTELGTDGNRYDLSFNYGYIIKGTGNIVEYIKANDDRVGTDGKVWKNENNVRMVINGTATMSKLHILAISYECEAISINESRQVNGRDYWLYVPYNVMQNKANKYPVVFSLHGAGNDYIPTEAGVQNFNNLADVNDFIVVYPRGRQLDFPGLGGVSTRGWQATGSDSPGNADVQYLRDLVGELIAENNKQDKQFMVDEEKFYITGFANGGMMAYAVANAAPELFAAYSSISGAPVNEMHLQHNGKRAVPFLHLHGKQDELVKYTVMPTIIDNMVVRNGLSYTPTTTSGSNFTKKVYGTESGASPYIYYEVEGWGHSADAKVGDTDSKQIVWNFFNGRTPVSNSKVEFKSEISVEHGWITDVPDNPNLIAKYGESGGYTSENTNVYHSIQLRGGNHYIKFNAQNADESKKVLVRLVKLAELEDFADLSLESAEYIEDVAAQKLYYCNGPVVWKVNTGKTAEYRLEFIAEGENDGTTISNISIETEGTETNNESEDQPDIDFDGYYRFNNRLSAQWNFDQCDGYRFNEKNMLNSTVWSKSTSGDNVVYTNKIAFGNQDNPDYTKTSNFAELTYDALGHKIAITSGLLFNAPAGHIKFIVSYADINGVKVQQGARLQVDENVKLCVPFIENTFRNDMNKNPQPNDDNKPDYKNSVHHWKRDILYVSLKEGNVWDVWTPGVGWKQGHIVNKCINDPKEELFNAGGEEKVNGVHWYKMNYTGYHNVPCVVQFNKTTTFNRLAVNRNLTYSFYSEYISDFGKEYDRPNSRIRVVGTPRGAQVANVGPFLNYDGAIAFTYGGWLTEASSDTIIGGNADLNDYYQYKADNSGNAVRVTDKWSELGVFTGQNSGAEAFKKWTDAPTDIVQDLQAPIAPDGFPVLSVLNNPAKSGSLTFEGDPEEEELSSHGKTLPNYHPRSNGNFFGGNNYPYKENITPWSLPTRGAYLKFEPSYPGVLNVDFLQLPNAVYHIVDEFGIPYSDPVFIKNATVGKSVVDAPATNDRAKGYKLDCDKADYVKYSFNVYPGKTYYLFSNEAGLGFAGFYFEPYVKRYDSKAEYAQDKNVQESSVSDTDIEYARKDVGVYEINLDKDTDYSYPTFSNPIKDEDNLVDADHNYEKYAEWDAAKEIKTIYSPTPGATEGTVTYEPFKIHYSKRAVKVNLNRSFKKDTWNTICLPFSMNQVQMENIFGKGTRVVLLRDLQTAERNKEGKRTLTLICHENQDIIAGYPYFILPKAEVENGFETYACFDKFPKTVGDEGKVPTNPTVSSVGPNTNVWEMSLKGQDMYTMMGTFSHATVKKGSLYVNANTGKLMKLSTGDATINPYRAWFQLTGENNNDAWTKKLDAVVGIDADFEDDATGIDIDELLSEQGIFTNASDVYSVNGQLVRKNALNLNDLPKGIYVVNGKKYIVK